MVKRKTKEEIQRYNAISEMGCVICRMPAEIHHCIGHEFGSGTALKSKWDKSIGLCTNHHRGAEGLHQVGVKPWESLYGTQRYHLTVVNEKLASMEAMK